MNYYVLNKFGIKLFGQNVTLRDNSGTIYNNIHGWYNWSVTCDCSYMTALLVMGLIPTIIVLIGYILLMKKAIKHHNYMIVSIALLLAIYSFCESQMCVKVCPNNQVAEKRKPIDWKEGWASENIRGRASSGGAAYLWWKTKKALNIHR